MLIIATKRRFEYWLWTSYQLLKKVRYLRFSMATMFRTTKRWLLKVITKQVSILNPLTMNTTIKSPFSYKVNDVVYIVSNRKKADKRWPAVNSPYECDIKLIEDLGDGYWNACSAHGFKLQIQTQDIIPANYLRIFKAGESYYTAIEAYPPFVSKGQIFVLDKKSFTALDGSSKFPYTRKLQTSFKKCTIWDNQSLS